MQVEKAAALHADLLASPLFLRSATEVKRMDVRRHLGVHAVRFLRWLFTVCLLTSSCRATLDTVPPSTPRSTHARTSLLSSGPRVRSVSAKLPTIWPLTESNRSSRRAERGAVPSDAPSSNTGLITYGCAASRIISSGVGDSTMPKTTLGRPRTTCSCHCRTAGTERFREHFTRKEVKASAGGRGNSDISATTPALNGAPIPMRAIIYRAPVSEP